MDFRVPLKLRMLVPRARAATFVYPAAGNPRIALLAPGFRETRCVRSFCGSSPEGLREFDPGVLVGTPAQLRRIARSGSLLVLPLRNAVIALTWEGEEPLSEADRDLFWEVFAVPVFEQYLSPANQLIATECEAHDGLHTVGAAPRREAWVTDPTPCACGDKRLRLVPAEAGARVAAAAPQLAAALA